MSGGQRIPLVTAHAGCLGTEPNSRASIERALASGADLLEFDLRLTVDGVVVLSHDPVSVESVDADSLHRAVNIESCTWDMLCHWSGGSLVRLEELLEILAGPELPRAEPAPDFPRGFEDGECRLNLDAKTGSAMSAAMSLVDRAGLSLRVVFSGLGVAEIRQASGLGSRCRYLFNADAFVPRPERGPESDPVPETGSGMPEADNKSSAQATIHALVREQLQEPGQEHSQSRTKTAGRRAVAEKVCTLARSHGCSGLNLDWRRADAEFIRACRELGLPVFLWTMDEPEEIRCGLKMGADSITTNHPDSALKLEGRAMSLIERRN